MLEDQIKWKPILHLLIGLTLVINTALIFSPFLLDNDPTIYFRVAKNMALHGHWLYLFDSTGPWLDKPHFPFWLTSLSFKIFGLHPWSYILPGFIFYLLGAAYTYKIAKLFYSTELVALFSLLIYLTTLRLMFSSLDVRAEAYLLGEIIPACYYWLKYHAETKISYLFLGALFTALGVMTKGPFIFITIASGFVATWIYRRQFKHFISLKWLSAIFFSLLLISPELISLYLQFGPSGPEWFIIGSQLGRFFDTGRITRGNGHYLFFVQTFLWAFLPWTIIFIASVYNTVKNFRSSTQEEKDQSVFLLASFFITFVIFSISQFQVDHYTNIIFPFAAIMSGHYLNQLIISRSLAPNTNTWVLRIQILISIFLLSLTIMLSYFSALEGSPYFAWTALLPMTLLLLMFIFKNMFSLMKKAIIFSALSINSVFLIFWLSLNFISAPLSAGYTIGAYLNKQSPELPIYEYQQDSNLDVYTQQIPILINKTDELPLNTAYYLVLDLKDVPNIMKTLPSASIILQKPSMSTNLFVQNLLHSRKNFNAAKSQVVLLKISALKK